VEDYTVAVEPFPDHMDYGDAPDDIGSFAYPTLLARRGAWHEIVSGGPCMGSAPDDEADGLPSTNALGDDIVSSDDEDGVDFSGVLVKGQPMNVKVDGSLSPTSGYINAWIDFNMDGDWEDPGERVASNAFMAAGGSYTVTNAIPMSADVGSTYARFRINSTGGITYEGPADDGEVEDYRVDIYQPDPGGTLLITLIEWTGATSTPPVAVEWNAQTNVVYQLQSAAELVGSNITWTDVGGHLIGPSNRQLDSASATQGFYRVVIPWIEE
jgi:hypothetical protein